MILAYKRIQTPTPLQIIATNKHSKRITNYRKTKSLLMRINHSKSVLVEALENRKKTILFCVNIYFSQEAQTQTSKRTQGNTSHLNLNYENRSHWQAIDRSAQKHVILFDNVHMYSSSWTYVCFVLNFCI